MAVPKRRHSNSRTGMRRAHDGIKFSARQLQACPRCGTLKLSHVVCPNGQCGHYMGRTIVEPA
jgi:large subunit ribosomal protein L32